MCIVEKKQQRARPGNRGDVIKFPHQHIGPAGRYDRAEICCSASYNIPGPLSASFVYSLTRTAQPPPPMTSPSPPTRRPNQLSVHRRFSILQW